MTKIIQFLIKNSTHVLAAFFLCWAVWGILNWQDLLLVQKLILGLFALLVGHEYEEGYKERFFGLMGSAVGIDPASRKPEGILHVSPDVYIAVVFTLALIFPNALWLSFACFLLAFFEGFVHTMGIFLFRLKGVSPGWYTAIIMATYSIWAVIHMGKNIEYSGITWLWAFLWFVATFLLMEMCEHRALGITTEEFIRRMKAFAKKCFVRDI